MISRGKLYAIVCLVALGGYTWMYLNLKSINHQVCMIKTVTGVPCPSCGTSRSVISIFNGNLIEGLLINPLGYLAIILSLVVPAWVFIDVLFHKSSFYLFYLKTESFLRKKSVAVPLIILLFINWIWNIHKQL